MAVTSPSVITARVSHTRSVPRRNSFAYRVDYLLLGEAELSGGPTPRLFSFGSRNLVSLHPEDHGFEGRSGPSWVRGLAAEAGLTDVAQVWLLTHPRYWGYAFNPVSFWFLIAHEGDLIAVIAEVHNTYGDRHCYICRPENGGPIDPGTWIEAEKRFHVSPFFQIEGRYRFRFALDPRRVGVWIDYEDGRGGGLHTALIGERRPLSDTELLRALIRRPLGAAKVTAMIHWQAAKLFLKGLKYRDRPDPASERVT